MGRQVVIAAQGDACRAAAGDGAALATYRIRTCLALAAEAGTGARLLLHADALTPGESIAGNLAWLAAQGGIVNATFCYQPGACPEALVSRAAHVLGPHTGDIRSMMGEAMLWMPQGTPTPLTDEKLEWAVPQTAMDEAELRTKTRALNLFATPLGAEAPAALHVAYEGRERPAPPLSPEAQGYLALYRLHAGDEEALIPAMWERFQAENPGTPAMFAQHGGEEEFGSFRRAFFSEVIEGQALPMMEKYLAAENARLTRPPERV